MEIGNTIKILSYNSEKEKTLLLKYGPALLTALLIVWLAAKLVSLTWLLLERPVYDATIDSMSATKPSVDSKIDYEPVVTSIVKANLFGAYVESPQGAAVVPTGPEVEEVELDNLTLKGTVASTTDSNGIAIIEKDGEEKVYTLRETVAPGYELERVFSDRVHLLHQGTVKSLLLPKLRDQAGTSSTRRSSNNRRASARPSPRSSVRAKADLTNTAASVPAKLGDLLRPQPVFQNGKQLGYRVYPGRKREQFKSLGLKAGDLVTEINGTPLNDPSRGLEIFRSLKDSTQVSVTVERNGAQTSLVLDTTQLNMAGN